MKVGRPKAEIPRKKGLAIRLTDFEFQKIERVAKEKNLSKTEMILQAVDLFMRTKPKKVASMSFKEIYKKRHGGKEPPKDYFD